jgi:hypothetical protein
LLSATVAARGAAKCGFKLTATARKKNGKKKRGLLRWKSGTIGTKMETLERVARSICLANGGEPSALRLDSSGPLWTVYIRDAQAAIDAMEEDMKAADRKARLECAEICDDETPYTYSAYIAADKIRETMK